MDTGREGSEIQKAVEAFEQQGWTVVRDYAITWRNRKLRADAVLLQDGALLAVLEVKIGQRPYEDAAPQLNILAEVLGAPLALLWVNGQVFQLRNIPGIVRGPLNTVPSPADALQFLGSLRQLFQPNKPACQAVTQAVHNWKHNGATRTGTSFLPAIEFYAAEHDLVCMKVPLTQCVLIGGILEGVLRETAVAKGAASNHTKSLNKLIIWCTNHGYITPGTGSITPHSVRNNRNGLHPNLFVTSAAVNQGVATNSAFALAAVVKELNLSV